MNDTEYLLRRLEMTEAIVSDLITIMGAHQPYMRPDLKTILNNWDRHCVSLDKERKPE